jgi:nucleotide-binding universal stress UspA family protein
LDSILIPLDGSQNAEQVLPYVALLGRAFDCRAILFTVVGSDASKESALAYLEGAGARLRRLGVTATAEVAVGDPAKSIVAAAEAYAPSMLAMTTYGLSGPAVWVLGSVAYRVVSATAPPVLLVRPAMQEERAPKITSFIVALDGSSLAEAGLVQAQRLAGPLQAEVHLVRVVPGAGENQPDVDGTRERAEEYLRRIVSALQVNGVKSKWTVLEGSPTNELAGFAGKTEGSVVVMTTHGASGESEWIMGNVTDKVLRTSTRPVLVVHPEAENRQPQRR